MARQVEQSRQPADGLLGMSTLNASLFTFSDNVNSKFYKDPVTLIVGADKESYTAHKDLLCFYSDFFHAALNGSFREAAERKIELPDTEVEVFEAFQVWLYTRKLTDNNVSTKVYPEYHLLVKLWLFGDKYQIPLLQNRTMDARIDKVDQDKETPVGVIHLAYENTTFNPPLRKAIATILAYRGKMSIDNAGETCLVSQSWPLQACLDTMAEMHRGGKENVARGRMPKRGKCYYHVHAADEHC